MNSCSLQGRPNQGNKQSKAAADHCGKGHEWFKHEKGDDILTNPAHLYE